MGPVTSASETLFEGRTLPPHGPADAAGAAWIEPKESKQTTPSVPNRMVIVSRAGSPSPSVDVYAVSAPLGAHIEEAR